jgi:hypothetical protein
MALQIDSIKLDELTADPGSPVEGQAWFNTTTHLFKCYRNGATSSFTTASELAAHTGDTANPHTTTLEQARTAGATLAGDIAMGTHIITGLGAGSATTDAAQRGWVTDQINSKVAGLDWQNPVLNSIDTPPATPTTGDRYRIIATATGAWAGKENQIAEQGASTWSYVAPVEGFIMRDMTANTYIVFDGAAWANLGNAVQHSALLGLTTGDDHTQYQLRSEKGSSGGYAGLTGTSITDTTHGARGGGTALHPLTTAGTAGFMPPSSFVKTLAPTVNDDITDGWVAGSIWLDVTNLKQWVCLANTDGAAVWVDALAVASGYLSHKAGSVLEASFSGTPKKATVTLSAAFADTNYAINLTPLTTVSGTHYNIAVESKTTSSFVINMGTSTTGDLVSVGWSAIHHGEST